MKINKYTDTMDPKTREAYLSAMKDAEEPKVITQGAKCKKRKKRTKVSP